MKKYVFSFLLTLLLMGTSQVGSAAQDAWDQATDDALVYAVHGVPGLDIGEAADLPVDVYINGVLKIANLKYGQIKGPIKVTPGNVTAAVYKAGIGPGTGNFPIMEQDFNFQKYENATVVGYLPPRFPAVLPKLVKFTNDLSPAGHTSKCRVIIHNTSEEDMLGYWFYNNAPQYDYHPEMGSDVLDPEDKNSFEAAKKSLIGNETFSMWLEIGVGWENWQTVYDKPLGLSTGRAILVYLVGSASTKTFKVIKKLVKLKVN